MSFYFALLRGCFETGSHWASQNAIKYTMGKALRSIQHHTQKQINRTLHIIQGGQKLMILLPQPHNHKHLPLHPAHIC